MRSTRQGPQEERAACYTRVSSEGQKDNFSLDGQLDEVRAFCEKQGWQLVEQYSDPAMSGRSFAKRPGLQRLLADAQAGKFEHLVTWKISRLGRNREEALDFVSKLSKCGVTYHSVSEPDFEQAGVFGGVIFDLLATLAHAESDNISDNVRLGMRRCASVGRWVGGAMLGYDFANAGLAREDRKQLRQQGGRPERAIVVVPGEAAVVREVFRRFAEGHGLWKIANWLNTQKVKTKRGKEFTAATVGTILDNPAYIGKVVFTRRKRVGGGRRTVVEGVEVFDGTHEPIIDQETWDTVRVMREVRKQRPARAFERGYPLTGLLRCPVCGSGMTMSRSQDGPRKDGTRRVRVYYACGAARGKGASVCRHNAIRAEQAERAVFLRLRKVATHPTLLREVVRRVNARLQAEVLPLQRRLAEIEKERRKLEASQERYFRAFEREVIDDEEFKARKDSLRERLRALSEEGAEVEARLAGRRAAGTVPFEAVKIVLDGFVDELERADAGRQRALLETLVESITFDADKKLASITLHLHDDVARVLGLPAPTGLPGPVTLSV
jgi:site-specific DNA recombinase